MVNVGLPAIMSAFGIGNLKVGRMGHHGLHDYDDDHAFGRAGWFADRFGNKRVYILGLVPFTLGS